jgi:hypothetical protein
MGKRFERREAMKFTVKKVAFVADYVTHCFNPQEIEPTREVTAKEVIELSKEQLQGDEYWFHFVDRENHSWGFEIRGDDPCLLNVFTKGPYRNGIQNQLNAFWNASLFGRTQ